MNYLKYISILVFGALMVSCTVVETESKEVDNNVTLDPIDDADSTVVMEPEIDVVTKNNAMQLKQSIEEYRVSIENSKSELKRDSIDLTTARAKISQDWRKLDFYMKGDEIVRIKTYPQISKKLQAKEFYFKDNELVFALVESDESQETGEDDGRAFYYDNTQLIVSEDFKIAEATAEERKEMKMGSSLQDEAKEYLILIYEVQD